MKLKEISDTLRALDFDTVLRSIADNAATPFGEDRILGLRPTMELEEVEQEFGLIENVMGVLERGEALPIAGIREIRPALKRTRKQGSRLEIHELLDIYQLLNGIESLSEYIKEDDEHLFPLQHLLETLHPLPPLQRIITQAIDIRDGIIKDSASPQLNNLRKSIRSLEQKSRKQLENLVSSYMGKGWIQETGYTISDGRFVVPVKSNHRGKIQGIMHGSSASGGTLYIEPAVLVDLANQLRQAHEAESAEIQRILEDLTQKVRENHYDIFVSIDTLGFIDSLQARAEFAYRCGAIRPAMGGAVLNLVEARHPLLLLRKGLDATIPLNLQLSSEAQTLVITGPNAGGKTVALKTVGLITSLAWSGIIPPCGYDSVIPKLETWHVVIGDDQSLESDLSSFSGHLTRLEKVLSDNSSAKLVLIDEIASGTDPVEGAALAAAILEEAVAKKWWAIITTHIGSLKVFAHKTEGIRNGSMEFNRERLEPTYRFVPDLPGSSYALEIAQRVGIKTELLENARGHLGTDKLKMETLIEELSTKLREAEREKRWLSIKQSETQALEKRLLERIDKLEAELAKSKKTAAEEAERILNEANRTIELVVKEIREKQASGEAIQMARTAMQKERENVKQLQENAIEIEQRQKKVRKSKTPPPPKSEEKSVEDIAVGDQVVLESGVSGEVLAFQGKRLQITAGSLKMWIKVSDIAKVKTKAAGSGSRVQVHLSDKAEKENVPLELDLRGKRYEEAQNQLEQYLDDAVYAGMPFVQIVHGKGTGALRSMVFQVVKKHRDVAEHRLGEPSEGGDGVTVVNFRKSD
ncbi:endonuclease MutS2 [bacterium]|nr:endonuclease MutS2 [bacterium]